MAHRCRAENCFKYAGVLRGLQKKKGKSLVIEEMTDILVDDRLSHLLVILHYEPCSTCGWMLFLAYSNIEARDLLHRA